MVYSKGAKLKKIRLEMGLSLDEVHKKTKIHPKILKAMEGDGLTDLSQVYLKSFLKIYCNFLGVEPEEFVADFKKPESGIKKSAIVKASAEKAVNPVAFLRSAGTKLAVLRFINKKTAILAGFILAGVFLLWSIFSLGKFIVSKISGAFGGRQSAGISEEVLPAESAVKPAAENKQGSGIRLIIRAKDNCWIQLKADGRVVFQRVLEKGRHETWQAKREMVLSLGNAGGVELEVNGQLFSNLGRKGQVRKNIVITKEGLKIPR